MTYRPGESILAIRKGKPNIARVWYPKMRRHFWRVSRMPKGTRNHRIWMAAHEWCLEANRRECVNEMVKYYATR